MRNFEERKEEIFRRSEVRIAKRKKNIRRIVVTCVPLVLCVSLATGWLLGGFGAMDSAAPESIQGDFNGSLSLGGDINYGMIADAEHPQMSLAPGDPVALEIGYAGSSHRYTDAQTLVAFQQMMRTEQPESSAIPESIDEGKTSGGWGTGDNIIKGDPYPVAVTYADGTVVWYTLRGNQLTRADGKVQIRLTDVQARWLHDLMEGK